MYEGCSVWEAWGGVMVGGIVVWCVGVGCMCVVWVVCVSGGPVVSGMLVVCEWWCGGGNSREWMKWSLSF